MKTAEEEISSLSNKDLIGILHFSENLISCSKEKKCTGIEVGAINFQTLILKEIKKRTQHEQ